MAAFLPDCSRAPSERTVRRAGHCLQQPVACPLRQAIQARGRISFTALLRGGPADGSLDDDRTPAPCESQTGGRVRGLEDNDAGVWPALPPGGDELLLSGRQVRRQRHLRFRALGRGSDVPARIRRRYWHQLSWRRLGWYTPIAGTQIDGFLARPIYYGMLLFAQAGAGQLVESKLELSEQAPLLTAYALRSDQGALKVAVFNKNLNRGTRLTIDPGQRAQRVTLLRLHAPRIDDTTDTTFGAAPVGSAGEWSVAREETLPLENGSAVIDLPAASAALITFEQE
jgi:glycosyl hydrolase family 79